MTLLCPQVGRPRRRGTVARVAVAIGFALSLETLTPFSNKALAQGFSVWGAPIGVGPSFPYPIGVYPGHPMVGIPPTPFYGPHFPNAFSNPYPSAGGYRDYRHEYNMRLADAYRAQMEIAAAYAANPMPQAEIERYLKSLSGRSDGEFRPGFGGGPGINAAIGTPHHIVPGTGLPGSWGPNADGDLRPDVIPTDVATADQIADSLRGSATRLDAALKRRGEEGQLWRDYLRLETILATVSHPAFSVDAVDPDESVQLGQAVNQFDGIVVAGDFRHIMRADGFAETRYWLKRLVDSVAAENGATGGVVSQPDDSQAESSDGERSDKLPPPLPVPR